MKFKSIIRKIAVVLVVIAAIYFPFYITKPTPPSKTVVVAQGINLYVLIVIVYGLRVI